jgi:hypothetical protein
MKSASNLALLNMGYAIRLEPLLNADVILRSGLGFF